MSDAQPCSTNFYLVEHGCVELERSYEDPGDLAFIGPFETPEDGWQFAAAFEEPPGSSEYYGPRSFDMIEIEGALIAASTIATPKERLRDDDGCVRWALESIEDPDDPDALDDALRALLNRWWPSWIEDGPS